MSEFKVELVMINSVEKHPDADSLSIAKVYDYPVIVRTDEFQEPTLAAYFPVDAVLPDIELFSFMWKGTRCPTEKKRRVKAVKLRGIFSMGLLIPWENIKKAFAINIIPTNVGDDVSAILNVHKYEEVEGFSMGGNSRSQYSWFPRYTEIENARKYAEKVMIPVENVVLTEKIHGTNARFLYRKCGDDNDGLWVGSHNLAKKNDDDNVWATIAKKYNLEEKLQKMPNVIFFGEIYGPIQKGFPYDSPEETSLVIFDLFDIDEMKYWDYDMAREATRLLELRFVPELFQGAWTCLEDVLPFAEGPSVLGKGANVREGFVLRLMKESWDHNVGRVVLKIHGEGYLTGKRRQK